MDTDYNTLLGQMINSPFATPSDRERMVALLLREHDSKFVTKEQIKDVLEMAEVMKKDYFESKERQLKEFIDAHPPQQAPKNKKTFTHKPSDMVRFLYQFSINNDIKWFTHAPDVDMNFVYPDYMEKAKKWFDEKTKKLSINASTYTNVSNFIFDTGNKAQDAYNEKIDLGWKDMKEWCTANAGRHPYDALFGNYRFEHYINIFKNTIQFRTDNSDYLFNKRVRTFIQKEINNNPDIKTTFTNNFRAIGSCTRTFIDVRQLFKFLRIVITWICEDKSKGSTVEVDLSENEKSYILSINHVGSYLNLDNEKLKGLSGDFRKARNILLNVADWTIQADEYRRGALNIICLDESTQNEGTDVVSENAISACAVPIGGVKHLITFYKNI